MSYKYHVEKAKIFTDEGQRKFLKIRDKVQRLLEEAGAFTMGKAIAGEGGSWQEMACVDRLVEIGEIQEITNVDVFAQYRIFVSTKT